MMGGSILQRLNGMLGAADDFAGESGSDAKKTCIT